MQNFAFKFQAVAEKTAKIVRGLLYFAAPCSPDQSQKSLNCVPHRNMIRGHFKNLVSSSVLHTLSTWKVALKSVHIILCYHADT